MEDAHRDRIGLEDALRAVERAVLSRLPGLGHRVHTTDLRVQALFEGARIIEERKARLVFE